MIPSRWQALAHLIEVRLREFYREPEVIFWVYGFPLVLAVGLGYAFSSDAPAPPDVDVADTSAPGRGADITKRINRALPEDAKSLAEVRPLDECEHRLKTGKTALYLVAHAKKVEYVYDPARSESAYARYWVEAVLAREPGDEKPTEETFITEPGARYIDFLLPGLIGTNIMGGGLFGLGFVIVDMRVRKLFKRLLATPMRHSDFLLSLFVSRLLFLLPEMGILMTAGYFWFGIPMRGSVFTLLVVILAGAAAFAGIGLLLGCRTEKNESISGLLNAVMMPMYIFSGVFFSSKRFPDEVQPAIQALPLTQLNDALREVMLEGASLWEISWRLGILAAYAVVTFTLAMRWFKWK
jgi:ABC-type multidrug transport system permease subunit